jgi:hypothetical protein
MSEWPALRISNIVYGRQTVRNRVQYFVDPIRDGNEKAVPETVVLEALAPTSFGWIRI